MFLYYGKNQESKVISNTIGYGGVEGNSDLIGGNYGNFCNFGFCFWTYSICSNRKTHKDFETKGNSRRELQGRVNHCFVQVSHC